MRQNSWKSVQCDKFHENPSSATNLMKIRQVRQKSWKSAQCDRFRENPSSATNFMKIRPVRAELFHAGQMDKQTEKQTGRRTDMKKLTVALGNFAKGLKRGGGWKFMGCGIRRQAYCCLLTDNTLNYLQPVAHSKLLRNFEYCLPADSVSYPTIFQSSRKLLWRSQTFQEVGYILSTLQRVTCANVICMVK